MLTYLKQHLTGPDQNDSYRLVILRQTLLEHCSNPTPFINGGRGSTFSKLMKIGGSENFC